MAVELFNPTPPRSHVVWSRLAFCCAVLGACPAALAAHGELDVPPEAVGGGPIVDGSSRINVRLLADVAAVTPGDTFHAGVLFNLDPGWHLYWLNPGDAGYATEVMWRVGDATLGPLSWPAPQTFRESDGVTTYGYAGEVLLLASATVSDSVANSLDLAVEVRYLACNVICSPHTVILRRQLPVGHEAVPADEATQALFAQFGKQVPAPARSLGLQVDAAFTQAAVRPGDDFRVAFLVHGCEGAGPCKPLAASAEPFAPFPAPGLTLHAVQTRPHPSDPAGLAIIVRGHVAEDAEPGELPKSIRGVLQLQRSGAPLRPVEIDVPLRSAAADTPPLVQDNALFVDLPNAVSAPPMPSPADVPTPSIRAWKALLLALLGGLILNLMPCVLPVLAIKVIGITQVGHVERREVVMHGVAYSAGVVGSMVLLALVVVGLRLVGTSVGWGFQFQEPWFVAAVSCVLVLFALNCFGVFEIYTSAAGLGRAAHEAHGWRRSVFDGILAVVLATPCSAPYLGSAVAYALTQGPLRTVAVFAVIGIGLAAPYVLLTWVPGLLRFVPKPGPWMNHIKTLLGFGLLATVVWLVWLIGRFAGIDAVARLLLFLLGVALVGWVYGLISRSYPSRQLLTFLLLAVLVTALGPLTLSFMAAEAPEAAASTAAGMPAKAYSNAVVLAELAAGRPVFVEFGADWCITCKFNEQHVLTDPAVVADMQRYNVALLRADWTRRDEGIQRTLATFGRSGVPMYLLYSPDNPTGPRVLPELLTVGIVRDALHSLGSH